MEPNYRRCVSCRTVGPKRDFWRIVRVYPSGQLQLDIGMGRSAYLCPQASCLEAAQKKNRLGKVLGARVPEEIYLSLSQRLAASSPAAGEENSQQIPRPVSAHPNSQQSLERK